MSWTAVPFILRLLAGIAVGFLLLYVGGILLHFLITISVHDHPPAAAGEQYEQYLQLSAARRFFLDICYFGIILELIFLPLVIKHISNASPGHLILFGFFIVIGLIGNIFALLKQWQLKR